jgi:hypothetical protein
MKKAAWLDVARWEYAAEQKSWAFGLSLCLEDSIMKKFQTVQFIYIAHKEPACTAQGDTRNRCLLWQSSEKRKYTVWAKWKLLSITPDEHTLTTRLQAVYLFLGFQISFRLVRALKRFILGTYPPL